MTSNKQLRLSPARLAEVIQYVETLFAVAQPGSLKADAVLAFAELEARRRVDEAQPSTSKERREPSLVTFDSLPLGARFRYPKHGGVFVKLGNGNCGIVAKWDKPELNWPGQGVYSFADSETERASGTVEWVDGSANEPKAPLPRIRLKDDIYDDGADHHPPGILAHKGDVLEVRELLSVGAAHPGRPPGQSFIVRPGEFEEIRPGEPVGDPVVDRDYFINGRYQPGNPRRYEVRERIRPEKGTADLRKALKDIYGVAQDLHSRLQGMTSVAETQRFLPAILAAHTALEGIAESSAEVGRLNVKTYSCECVGGCKGQMSLPPNFRCRRRAQPRKMETPT